MSSEIIKLSISEFVNLILHNDAERFEFLKRDEKPNINKLLNKLIPNLLLYRKNRRQQVHNILVNDFARGDAEKVYECVNNVIDLVYFSDEELDCLKVTVWLRPSQKNMAAFDEIENSEAEITCQNPAVYIRGLLNEYSRLPQYKREQILFNNELENFNTACQTGRIFRASVNGKSLRLFAFSHVYEYTYSQKNYLISYDISNNFIGAIPLYKIRNEYLPEKKYKPSPRLIEALQEYYEGNQYEDIVKYTEEESC